MNFFSRDLGLFVITRDEHGGMFDDPDNGGKNFHQGKKRNGYPRRHFPVVQNPDGFRQDLGKNKDNKGEDGGKPTQIGVTENRGGGRAGDGGSHGVGNGV